MKKYFWILFAFCSFPLVKAQVPKYVNTDSLVGWWPFDANVFDQGPQKFQSLITNPDQYVKDRFGRDNKAIHWSDSSIIFNNFNKSTYVSTTPLNSKSITLSFWIKPDITLYQDKKGKLTFFDTSFCIVNGYNINVKMKGAYIEFSLFGESLKVYHPERIKENEWQHIVLVKDGDHFYGKVNQSYYSSPNAFKGTTLYGDTLTFGTSFVTWSDQGFGGVAALNGSVDDLGIWNRALDTLEIATLYASKVCLDSIKIQPQDVTADSSFEFFTCASTDSAAEYQWQTSFGFGWIDMLDTGVFSGTQTDTFNISGINSSYHGLVFRCIVKTGCGYDTSNIVRLWVPQNNLHVPTINQLNIFPNPARNLLSFELLHCSTDLVDYTIYSATGSITRGKSIRNIDISSLSKGIYYIEIRNHRIPFIKE